MRPLYIAMNDEPETGLNLLQKGLQRALVAKGVVPVHGQRAALTRKLARVVAKAGLVRPLASERAGAVTIVPVVWASQATLFPYAYTRRIVPFIFDCWPEQFDRWESLLRKHRVNRAYFTARDAGQAMERRIPGFLAHWLPEACEPERFSPALPLNERTIHVLEMGRKHLTVHDRLVKGLAGTGIKHLFSKKDSSTPIFVGLSALYGAMADTAVCICYPKSVTHNSNTSEAVETLTQRYLETIGSGALAVGECPGELKDIFGFNPVIELSAAEPAGHVLDILRNISDYQAHAGRCLARLKETCTFDVRADDLLRSLTL